MGLIHPAISEICVPQSLDPICSKFDKFLAHGQAHMGQMGKWPWQCTSTGLDNSTELRMEKIRQAVTEIWVPQVWQPPARPPARTVTTIPLEPERQETDFTNSQSREICVESCLITLGFDSFHDRHHKCRGACHSDAATGRMTLWACPACHRLF